MRWLRSHPAEIPSQAGNSPTETYFPLGRDVPTLYLAAEDDVPIPLAGVHELFERTPATRQMVILRRADHLHFMDNVEQEHETMRAMSLPGAAAWIRRKCGDCGTLLGRTGSLICARTDAVPHGCNVAAT